MAENPAHLSVSSFNTYMFCPRKLYLEEKLGLKRETPKSWQPDVKERKWLASDRLRLRGAVDCVDDSGEMVIAIHEKKGKAPKEGVWPGHRVQMGAYLLLLEEMHAERPVQGIVRYSREDERNVVMNPYLRYEVLEVRDKILHMLAHDSIPKYAKEEKCTSCSMKEQCYDEQSLREIR